MIGNRRRLEGKVVAITGTASGQGREAAIRFAAEGAVIHGCDRNTEDNRATADSVRAAGGTMYAAGPVDLTNEDQVRDWFSAIASHHTHLDVLYANAGFTRFNPVLDISLAEWRELMTAETDVVFLPVKHAWNLLRASPGASVILVGSTAGVSGSRTNHRLVHTAAKGAVIAMTKQLAAEGAPHRIRVNCISPGMIHTPQSDATLLAPDHPMNAIANSIPLGRIGTPSDVARTALFFASDDSSYITGTNIMVDGGWSAVLPG